jgi:hypothetical protein
MQIHRGKPPGSGRLALRGIPNWNASIVKNPAVEVSQRDGVSTSAVCNHIGDPIDRRIVVAPGGIYYPPSRLRKNSVQSGADKGFTPVTLLLYRFGGFW